MTAALALGQRLAGAVVALMYSGGNVLEEIAVSRAEHNLRSLVDRAGRNDYQPGERQYGCFRQLRTFWRRAAPQLSRSGGERDRRPELLIGRDFPPLATQKRKA